MTNDQSPPDKHYSDPEIIPPGRNGDGLGGEDVFWPREFTDVRRTHRIYITRISPLRFLPFALVSGLISIVVLLLMFGFFIFLIPVAGIVLAGALIANFLRGPSRWRRY
jgi:hypothetical protein